MDQKQQTKELSFLRTLVGDIEHALRQVDISNTASDRRNALRSIISAMEGTAWIYRTHILSVMQGLDISTPKLEFAFSETTLFVSEQGEIKEQQRFISATSMIRLATRTAQGISQEIQIDFTSHEWQKLKDAIKLRNRITHPKNIDDLAVTLSDLQSAHEGLRWLITSLVNVMETTLKELSAYNTDAVELLGKLRAGDPDTIALYERVRREPDD